MGDSFVSSRLLSAFLLMSAIAGIALFFQPTKAPEGRAHIALGQPLPTEGAGNRHHHDNHEAKSPSGDATQIKWQERDLFARIVVRETQDEGVVKRNTDAAPSGGHFRLTMNFTGQPTPQNNTNNGTVAASLNQSSVLDTTKKSPAPSPRTSSRPSPKPSTTRPTTPPQRKPTGRTSKPSWAPAVAPTSSSNATQNLTSDTQENNTDATMETFGPIQFVGNEVNFFAPYPLAVCQGDCDTNSDCGPGLYCYQRQPYGDVPGCAGGDLDSSSNDFCVWNVTTPPPPQPTMRPTQRRPTPRPSIKPTSEPTSEPTSTLTLEPTLTPTFKPFGPIQFVGNAMNFYAPYPLGVCQGDCDSNDDCAPGLFCFQRRPFGAVPGCAGGDEDPSSNDFCVWNGTNPRPQLPVVYEDVGRLEYVGNDGTFYSMYPLGPCQGDCDNDDDCAEGLYCRQGNTDQYVPGCTVWNRAGEELATADFCAWNTSYPRPAPRQEMPADAFRLKLYWEEGYRWQNETIEREWCMNFDYEGYPGTGVCWYARDSRNCSSNQLYMGLCLDYDPHQWFTFVDLGATYSGSEDHPEVLIQLYGEGSPRCVTRYESAIFVQPYCNPEDPTQRFFALTGSFTDNKFELGQYQGYTLDNCVTNAHHPKSGEVIEFHICEFMRDPLVATSFWVRF